MPRFEHHPPPRFATHRDPAWRTEGGEITRTAKLLGLDFMPWQRQVVDAATEYRILGPGDSEGDRLIGQRAYRYRYVIVTVPRQSGKTTLMGPVRVHRLMTRPKASAFSTAQTGKDAGKRMKDLIELVNGSPLAPMFKAKYSLGSEGLKLPANGSELTRFSPKTGAIHGETPHLVDFDEFWKYSSALGNDLLGGVSPSMITLAGTSQIWMISTMGTAESGFMNEWVEKGRAREPGVAYFEWSMPDGLDPYAPSTWWSFHPALGNTIGEADLAAEMGLPRGEWTRAYMNRLTAAADPLIEPDDFARLRAEWDTPPAWSEIVVGYEVFPGNTAAAVYGTWRDRTGKPCTHVIHVAPGVTWLDDLLVTIDTTHRPLALAADDGGETRAVTDRVNARLPEHRQVYTTGMRDFGTACVGWLTAARDQKTFRHDGSAAIAQAVMHAVLYPSGDSWRFSRRHSTGPIAALNAVVVGLWAYDHLDHQTGKPELRF